MHSSMYELPTFPYHPRPLTTGSVVRSSATCDACNTHRSYMYALPFVTDSQIAICPWCIADGSVYERFGPIVFNEMEVGGGIWCDVDDDTRMAVLGRTPGIPAWSVPHWPACCGDAAAYVGAAGQEEIVTRFPEAIADLKRYMDVGATMSESEWELFFEDFDLEGHLVAQVFRCTKCGLHTAFPDID